MDSSVIDRLAQARVVVVGDVLLDRFVEGKVGRVSPEAPVAVLNHRAERSLLGGAGNVAANLVAYGARAILVGVAGRDAAAEELRTLCATGDGLDCRLVTDSARPTTVKTRYLSGWHQLLRVDAEDTSPLPGEVARALLGDRRGGDGRSRFARPLRLCQGRPRRGHDPRAHRERPRARHPCRRRPQEDRGLGLCRGDAAHPECRRDGPLRRHADRHRRRGGGSRPARARGGRGRRDPHHPRRARHDALPPRRAAAPRRRREPSRLRCHRRRRHGGGDACRGARRRPLRSPMPSASPTRRPASP